MEFSMKLIMVLIITCGLFSTFGCNYDYGKYGKNKTESGSVETNGQEAIPKQEAGSKNWFEGILSFDVWVFRVVWMGK